jgi:RNA polymerase sigma-70 factor (ECF subfamily)
VSTAGRGEIIVLVDRMEETMAGGGAELDPVGLQALARGATLGDPQAFTEIVQRYKGSVFGLCRRYVSEADAEDLAQETFVRAFVHRERFDSTRPLKPWLLTIARNLCIDRLRSHEQRHGAETDVIAIADRSAGAEQAVATRQELELLARGLEQLAEGPREAIALYHLEQLSYREMSEVLGVPIGTVMTWLYRGRKRLRELIRPDREAGADRQRADSGGC